ncbi:MAG: hypothetical protein R3326_06115 [Gemmatimonadota bacterium]|nr:hypothetical protein [Gemmatimonadota bacterium]
MRAWIPPLLLSLLAVSATDGTAQHRPIRAQDPVPVESGHVRVEAGIEWLRDRSFPLTGLEGELWRIPTVGFSIGFGRAELQIDGGFQALAIASRDPTAPFADQVDVDGETAWDQLDPVVAVKVLLRHEGAVEPAVGVRLATRLPSADTSNGIGTDAMEFDVSLLAAKSLGNARVGASVGLGVLAVPQTGNRQNDVLTYGAFMEAPLGGRWTAVAGADGRVDLKADTPPGTEDLGQARLGVRRDGRIRWDAALIVGLADVEPDVGLTVGGTIEFDAFENTR